MDSPFDFTQFKAQHELHNAFRALSNVLQSSSNADNVPNFPTIRGQATPFEQLLKDLKIDVEPAAEPEFNFEFVGVTLAEVEAHCIANQLDFMRFTQNRGHKLYYNRGYDEESPVWIEMSRPEASDAQQEFSELIYLDQRTLVVDWKTSLSNLKRLSIDRRYTEQMMHGCLLRIVNKFMPEQTMLLKQKTSNEIAKFLLKLDSKVDKLSYYRQQLFTFQRNIGEELDSVMARLTNLLDKIYPPNVAENAVYRENILKTAIVSFTPDQISVPILDDIKRAASKCIPMTYESILSTALAAERFAQISVAVPLTFGRKINTVTAASHIQFNSINNMFPEIQKKRKNEYVNDFVDTPDYNPHIQGHYVPQEQNVPVVTNVTHGPPYGTWSPNVRPQNVSNLTQPIEELTLRARSEPESHESSESENEITMQTPKSEPSDSPITQNLPTVDYNDLNPTIHLIPTQGGINCVLQNQIYRVLNVPAEFLNSPLPRAEVRLQNIARGTAFSSTPVSANLPEQASRVGKPRKLIQTPTKSPREDLIQTIRTRSQSRKERQEGEPTKPSDASLNATSFNVQNVKRYPSRSNSRDNKDKSLTRDNPKQPERQRSRDRPRDSSRDQFRNRQRYPSRERSQERSRDQRFVRDRDQRSQSRDRNRSQTRFNRDSYPGRFDRNDTRGRYDRSNSRGRFDRNRSRDRYDRNDRNSSRDRYNRGRSRDRRDQSRNNVKCYRCGSTQRSSERRDRTKSPYSRNFPRDKRDNRSKSRDNSLQSRKFYPEMKKGENCGLDYNPLKRKFCRKCPFGSSHHEFHCFSYPKFNNAKCTICEKYNHFASDCKEVNSFPPKVSHFNSTDIYGKN